jgi:phosphoribosylamine-glycine ligase
MKMLVVRSGGREHALAEKLSEAGELFIAHGNAGTAHRYKLPKSN